MEPRNQAGNGGMGPIGAVLLTIFIIAMFDVLFDVELIGYLDSAADWVADLIRELVADLGD